MFSGIVEGLGEVRLIEKSGSNLTFTIACPFVDELKIDQSVAHNGVCLTVTKILGDSYCVDVIKESLNRSNLGQLIEGNKINLERSLSLNSLLDGHLVQGHVDQTAVLKGVKNLNGSWVFSFEFVEKARHVLIDKGSICVNGVSLTLSKLSENGFEVSIIPYTFEHTNFHDLREGDQVNIEFDVIGKYVERLNRS